jgi:hypothetical protein
MDDLKSKMVSLRLSPEEYRQFRAACSSQGIRSFSELARNAMQDLIETKGSALPLYLEFRELRDRITVLSAELDRLAVLLDSRETTVQ